MSKLRQSVLEQIRILGNSSGCHQLPERSFFYHGKQFPVCARCTGVAIGQITAIIVSFFLPIKNAAASLFLLIMGFDWFIQQVGIKESNNIRRLLTGFFGGFGVFTLYINLIKSMIRVIKNKL